LNKVQKDDLFYVVYEKKIYKYKVTDVKIVDATEINYMAGAKFKSTVTLMTCWPAGTTLKRLVVVGLLQGI
jgi:LPXTG-site transpeptidase (sortase) family protein